MQPVNLKTKLPLEVREQIVSFLPLASRGNLDLVCKDFSERQLFINTKLLGKRQESLVAEQLANGLNEPNLLIPERLKTALNEKRNIAYLAMYEYECRALTKPNLAYEKRQADYEIFKQILVDFIRSGGKIDHLYWCLGDIDSYSNLSRCSNGVWLPDTSNQDVWITDEKMDFFKVFIENSKLQTVCLQCLFEIKGHFFQALSTSWVNLISLVLEDCSIDGTLPLAIFPKLTSLCIARTYSSNRSIIPIFNDGDRCSKITSLALDDPMGYENDLQVLRHFPNMIKLRLSDRHFFCSRPQELLLIESLTTLEIKNINHLFISLVKFMLQKAINLKTLIITLDNISYIFAEEKLKSFRLNPDCSIFGDVY